MRFLLKMLGDECMCSIIIILSAPPRCMWHGRVTHDPNRLCICIQKQNLNSTNLGGALAYHILLKATMFFILIIICRRFDLYVVINYQKGEIGSATNP